MKIREYLVITLFLSSILLSACQVPARKEPQLQNPPTSFQLPPDMVLAIARARTKAIKEQQELEKLYAKPETIAIWVKMVQYRFNQHFKPSYQMLGNLVKIQVLLDDNGNVINLNIVSSSGHEPLNSHALESLTKAAPFPVSGLSEADKISAKNVILVFAPKLPY